MGFLDDFDPVGVAKEVAKILIDPIFQGGAVVTLFATDLMIQGMNAIMPSYDYTVGYHNKLSMHIVYCVKLDELLGIECYDYTVFAPGLSYQRKTGGQTCQYFQTDFYVDFNPIENASSCVDNTVTDTYPSVTTNTNIEIYRPRLFQGLQGQGGLDGSVDIMFGEPTQSVNTFLNTNITTSEYVPTYRNTFSILVKDMLVGYNTSEIKPWSIFGTRVSNRYQELMLLAGTPERANDYLVPSTWITRSTAGSGAVARDMNPAHMILDCLLDSDWGGLGFDLNNDIDEVSFYEASQILHAETFGLSMLWTQQETIEDFIYRILAHINAILYVDPLTGKFTLKLIRELNPIIVLNTSNILSLENYESKATSETINKLTVMYTNYYAENGEGSVTVTANGDMALDVGGDIEIVATSKEYWGIHNADLAGLVATRELRSLTANLTKLTCVVNRTVYNLLPGDVFTLNWEPLGITDLAMRVVRVDYGLGDSAAMRIDAVADVFLATEAIIDTVPDSDWIDPFIAVPEDIPIGQVHTHELSYVEAYNKITAFDPTKHYALHSAISSDDRISTYQYHEKLSTAPTFTEVGAISFAGSYRVTLAADLCQEITSTIAVTASVDTSIRRELAKGPILGSINSELVILTGIDTDANEITISRGAADTVVSTHISGTDILFYSTLNVGGYASQTELEIGDILDFRICPIGTTEVLPLADATTRQIPIVGKSILPYPPANVLVNGESYPTNAPLKSVYDDTMYMASTLHTTNSIYQDRTQDLRIVIDSANISFTGYNSIQFTLVSVGNYHITECYIGIRQNPGIYNDYDFTAAPQQVTFNGSTTLDMGSDNILSDPIELTVGADQDILVSMTVEKIASDPSLSTIIPIESVDTTGTTYALAEIDEASAIVASNGYIGSEGVAAIESIRLADIATDPYTRIAWNHRDKDIQEGEFIGQDDALDYGPPTGATYTLRFYNDSDSLIRTISGITGKYYDYVSTMEIADNGGSLVSDLRFELETVDGTYTSTPHNITVSRAGWGMAYGNTYGE